MTGAAIEFPARRVLVACLIGIGLLVSAHAVRSALVLAWPEPTLLQGELLRILSIGAESGLATWFTLLMMLSTALVAVLIGVAERAAGAPRSGYWFGVAAVMLLASLDEQIQLHEMWVEPFRALFSITTGPFLLAWVIPALIVAALVALIFVPWVVRLPARTRLWAIAAVALWIAGAAGMEMVDSATFEWRQAMDPVRAHWVSAIIYTTEEAMEMLGVAVLLHTLLVHAREHAPAALGARIRIV
ncbi:MAG: hypothetical protein ACO1N6_11680 [Microcella sp.]